MKTSESGFELIKRFEGFKPETYEDVGGLDTIGYGHLVLAGESFGRITEKEAEDILAKDVMKAENCIDQHVGVDLAQNEFDALVSFIFNVGCANFTRSTMLKMINSDNFKEAADEFPKWNRAAGRIVKGLVNRRAAERKLFLGE